MPDSAESHWQLGEPQEFVHLYFGDNYLKRIGLESLNLDPRIIQLPELNFHSSAKLQALYNYQIKLMDWTDDECISIQQHTDAILITLLTSLNLRVKKQSVKGGLPPRKIAIIHDYICSHYGDRILLSDLARQVNLSEFHFCRTFKESTTYTPQEYVTKIRLEYAKEKLSYSDNSLIDVAFSCGFNSQSHFGRLFVKAFGVSPAKYRKTVNNM
ncbi:helix-turn-helix transcriptional regulator [Pseudoalteromonas piscicida]